jgi:hypothetical protein
LTFPDVANGTAYPSLPCRAPAVCGQEMAYEQEQRYKIGKVILEKAHIEKESGWH